MKKMVSMVLAAALAFALAIPAFAETYDFSHPIVKDVYCTFGSEYTFGPKVYHVVIEYNVTDGAINEGTNLKWDAASSTPGYKYDVENACSTIVHNPTNIFAMTNYSNGAVNYNLSFAYATRADGYDVDSLAAFFDQARYGKSEEFISKNNVTDTLPSAENPNFQNNKTNEDYWAGEAHSATASIEFNLDEYWEGFKNFMYNHSSNPNAEKQKLGTLTLTLTPQ